jgi:hypothetical protein
MKIKLLLLSLAIVLMSFVSFSKFVFKNNKPTKITWETLRDVTFKKKWYAEENIYALFASFGPSITKLNNKELLLTGYVLPIDMEANIYALSAFPFSACFFCGGAGPESVVGLKFKKTNRKFKVNQQLSFKGILRLNDDNIYELNYILENVEIDGE